MNKIIPILLFFFILTSVASAQTGNIGEQIEDSVEGLENNITKIKEFGEKDKWDFIGSRWKEFLLKNKAIVGIDTFFTKINIVFVILFGMDWELSMQMFFAFLFWIFTFFSCINYFSKTKFRQTALIWAFLTVLFLAVINLFEYFGEFGVWLVFYSGSFIWKLFLFVFVIVLIISWFGLNKFIAKRMEKSMKRKKEEKTDVNLKKIDNIVKGLEENI